MNKRPFLLLLSLSLLAGCPSDGTIPAEDSGDTGDTDPGTGDTDIDDTDDTDASCPDVAAVPLGACLAWTGTAPEGFGVERFTTTITGTVDTFGRGAPPVDCTRSDGTPHFAALGDVGQLAADDAAWVQLTDTSGTVWTLAWWLPEADAPAVDAEVTVTMDWLRGFEETRGHVQLAGADGALHGWLAVESRLATPPEGVTATLGASVCTALGDCDNLEIHTVEVAKGAATATLAPGEGADLDGLRVTLGEAVTYTSTGECEDGAESVVQIGVGPV